MSDFNSYIKDKYKQEVQPQYSDEAWDKFAAFAKIEPKKKDRKWLILFLGSLLVATILSVSYFMSIEKDESVDKSSDYYKESVENATIAIVEKSEINLTNEDLNNNEAVQEIIQSYNNEILNNKNKSNGVILSANDMAENSKNKNDQINNLENGGLDPQMEYQQSPTGVKSNEGASVFDGKDRKIGITSFLPQKMSYVNALSEPDIESRIIIPAHNMNNQAGWIAGVEIGTGSLYHRSINDKGTYLFSGILMYDVNSFLRIKTMLGFQHSSYSSKVLNRNLGLRSINYPDREARLDRVLSTTTYAEAGLGIDYIFPDIKGFKIFAGPSVIYLKELSRNLDYEFDQGEVDLESINIELQELQSHPLNLMLNLGVYYQFKNGISLSLKGEYLKAFKDSEVQLPKQIRYKLGIEKKF